MSFSQGPRNPFSPPTIGHTEPPIRFAFSLRSTEGLHDGRRRFTSSPEDIALTNPNTRICPTFPAGVDVELVKRLYSQTPVLIEERKGDARKPSDPRFLAMFHMANDSDLLVTAGQLRDDANL